VGLDVELVPALVIIHCMNVRLLWINHHADALLLRQGFFQLLCAVAGSFGIEWFNS